MEIKENQKNCSGRENQVMKRWCISFFGVLLFLLLILGGMTIFVDPFFHFHKPFPGLAYVLDNERYQNDGIVRNFDYDAVITGTSMTQNFKTTEFDSLFQAVSVKVPFSGASYKEINNNLERAINSNQNIRIILRGLDYDQFAQDADQMHYESYPEYLYDDDPFNDTKYFFNKTILIKDTYRVIARSRYGYQMTSFDEYKNWNADYVFGKDAILQTYARPSKAEEEVRSEGFHSANIDRNVIALAEANPQIEFYYFFTPYSIFYWDSLNQTGMLKKKLSDERKVIELILPHDNIHLFSFFDEFDMICNADHYKDIIHYSEEINSKILTWMACGEHELTEENYEDYCQRVWKFYTEYNYDLLYES